MLKLMVHKIITELQRVKERHGTWIKVAWDIMPFQFVITDISDELAASVFSVVKEE
jgi:hypothetical protein